jgi:hypothetical protein
MKLTSKQIEHLYQFTRQHYVEWYDLQTELVDHLANAIEQQWQENPKISFEDALQAAFKKFGVFGFMDVVEKRQIALGEKYNRLIWKHFIAFFKIPQIVGVFLFSFLVGEVFKNIYFDGIYSVLFLVGFVLTTTFFLITKYKTKKKKEKQKKIWLFENMIYSYGNATLFMYLPFQFINGISHFHNLNSNTFLLYLMSFFTVSFYLVMYVVTVVIPSKAEVYLKETYPEYALENGI